SVRDVAVVYQWLLGERELTRDLTLVGLGFGGWIAAEMATMAPRGFKRLVLVGAMGIKPERGEIADQALLSYIDYVRRGFADQRAFDRLFGAEPTTAQLEQWDLNRAHVLHPPLRSRGGQPALQRVPRALPAGRGGRLRRHHAERAPQRAVLHAGQVQRVRVDPRRHDQAREAGAARQPAAARRQP